ncbi:hypothetical protein PENTCL1PPCAC_2282, partial [Pristionchus entomophagus]
KEGEEKNDSEKDQTDRDMTISPSSSSSFQANGEDLLELGRKSILLLKKRCNSFTEAEDYDITTPKRKRKPEDEENEEEIEKEVEEGDEKEECGEKKSATLLTPSLTRGTMSKRQCTEGIDTPKWMGTRIASISSVASISIHSSSVTPRRNSSRSGNKREELIDTPESSQKEEEKEKKGRDEEKEKK